MELQNWQRFDDTLNIWLIIEFFEVYETNQELINFAFDYLENGQALEYLLDYTWLEDDFEEYVKENRDGYIEEEDEDEEDEEEQEKEE